VRSAARRHWHDHRPGNAIAAETSTLGPHTYTVTAKSKYEETGTASISYTVVTPEFGRCLKVASGKGKYKTATCTTTTTTNAYEWYPAFGREPLKEGHFTTAIKSSTRLLLETKGKEKLYCTGQSGTGEYSGASTVAGVILTLTGCYKGASTDHCQSTNAEGEIVTNALGGQLGVVKREAEASKDKLGLQLKAASGEAIAEFKCASTPVKLRGSVIVEVKANSMLSTVIVTFAQSKGVQKWTDFAGGTANEDVLEAQIGEAGKFEQTGLALTTIQTNEEKVEANSVV